MSDADLVWYGMSDGNRAVTARNVAYKIIGSNHNWNIDELNKNIKIY